MALVKFARGKKASYISETYADYVYFASDTHEIILNGVVYGYDTSSYLEVSGISVSGDTLTITYTDATGTSTAVTYKAPSVSGSEGNAVGVTYDSTNNDYNVALTIDSNDKILTQSESGLLTNLGIDYYSTTSEKLVRLLGADGAVISTFDATAFVKDGMIESVELVHENEKGESGEFIKITWNTDEGGDETYLDVTELVDVYTEGNGISIKDSESTSGAHEISVKIAGSQVNTGERWDTNYLTLDEEGNLCAIGIDAAIAANAVYVIAGTEEAHINVTATSTVDSGTTYTVTSDDVASAKLLGTQNDAADAGTAFGAIATNAANIATNSTNITTLTEALTWVEVE